MKSSKLYIFSDLTIFLVAFVCGFIHPEVAFKWHFFFPTMVLSVLIIILVAIVRFLISVVKRSNITNRLVKLILAVSLFFALAWGRNLVFYGTVVHYKIVNSYQNVIDWAETVNLQEFDDECYALNWATDDLPDEIAEYNSYDTFVYESNDNRVIVFSWVSTLMSYEMRLTITSPKVEKEDINFPEKTYLSAKIKDGVYLSQNTF